MDEITIAEYQALKRKKPSKYRNQPTKRDGYSFDSLAEARRYDELCLLVTAGIITNLVVHPVYELQSSFQQGGATYRAVRYEGDFSYVETGRVVVEDVKGKRTTEFIIKEKLFRFRYPDIDLRIIESREKR